MFLGLIGLVLGLFPFALAFFFGLACGIGFALGALGFRARGLFCDLALELGAGPGFFLGPPLRFDLGDELADVTFDIVEEFLLCRLRVVELGAGRFEFLLARARLGLALLERGPRVAELLLGNREFVEEIGVLFGRGRPVLRTSADLLQVGSVEHRQRAAARRADVEERSAAGDLRTECFGAARGGVEPLLVLGQSRRWPSRSRSGSG